MASKTQICNMMLVRIGVTKFIANIESDQSKEANALNLIFADELAFVIRDFPWPFATAYKNLELVAGSQANPVSSDWVYAYRYPSNCVFARRLVTIAGRKETNPPPYRVGRDGQGKLLYTNQRDAELEYTIEMTAAEELDALAISMLAWKLGTTAAPSMSRVKKMVDTCREQYEIEKSKAQRAALNEQQQEIPPDAEMIADRA